MRLTSADKFDLGRSNSLLLLGQTGSGKSVLEETIIDSLVKNLTPADLKFVLLDMTGVDFITLRVDHNDYILKDVKFDSGKALDILDEMAELSEKRQDNESHKPTIFICIEECDMAMVDQARFERAMHTITNNARGANIKLVYSTSRIGGEGLSKTLISYFDVILAGAMPEDAVAYLGLKELSLENQFEFMEIKNTEDR